MASKEISKSEIIFFKEKSGTGSVVEIQGKGNYFMPALKGLRLEGNVKPIVYGEAFLYLGHTIVEKGPGYRTIKIDLSRKYDSSIFSIEEHFLKKYFGIVS